MEQAYADEVNSLLPKEAFPGQTETVQCLLDFIERQSRKEPPEKVFELMTSFITEHPEIDMNQLNRYLRCFLYLQENLKQAKPRSESLEMLYRFHQKPVAFLHIPKTGGTYIRMQHALGQPVLSPMVIWPGHVTVIETPYFDYDKLNLQPTGIDFLDNQVNELFRIHLKEVAIPIEEARQCFILASVRNPFATFVSLEQHMLRRARNGEILVRNHDIVGKGFEYFLKSLIERSGDQWRFPQFFTDKGNWVVDWVARTETLDSDLERFAHEQHLTYRPGQRHNVGDYEKDYRQYYTDELIDLVYQTCSRELKLFGYDFDGVNLEKAIVKNEVSPEFKEDIKFDLKTNTLTIAGEIFE